MLYTCHLWRLLYSIPSKKGFQSLYRVNSRIDQHQQVNDARVIKGPAHQMFSNEKYKQAKLRNRFEICFVFVSVFAGSFTSSYLCCFHRAFYYCFLTWPTSQRCNGQFRGKNKGKEQERAMKSESAFDLITLLITP